ncbi:MAG: hypothetical protein JW827_12630 [Spirochaetes bacterium]|nr:hypothetical protein [Spirochaetota bacterium]
MASEKSIKKRISLKELAEINKLKQALGIDILDLPFQMDPGFIKKVQCLIQQKPFLGNRNVLLLSEPQFKYHEKNILLFLNRKYRKCDCCFTRHASYSAKAKLKNVRYIPKTDIQRSSYDHVIVYNCLEFFSHEITKIKGDKFILLLTPKDGWALAKKPEIYSSLEKFLKKTTCFILFKHHLAYTPFTWSKLKIGSSINWPATLDLFFKVPEKPLFDYLFMGGCGRDYQFLYEHRELFKDKKVIITHCDAHKHTDVYSQEDYIYDSKYTRLLKKNRNFVCLNRINEPNYCKVLLYSRVTICLFRGIVRYDSACISDALWYGKPVITNQTMATEYMKDYIFFIRDGSDLQNVLQRLEDPAFLQKVSEKAMRYARKENNIYNILKKIK